MWFSRNTFDPYPEKNCGQMTIFYAGEVSVYDDVPISKVCMLYTCFVIVFYLFLAFNI